MMKVRPLNPELQKLAEADVNEKSGRVASDIKALKEWLKKQPHLSSVNPSDQWLVVFLRGCKFSLERAKEKLDMYYTLRTIVPEFFGDRDPMNTKVQLILKLGIFLPLRKCSSPDSPRICIHRLGVIDTSKFHLSDVIKVSYMITEILMLEDDHFGVAGEELIIDLKDVGVSVISQWTPGLAKKSVMSFEKAAPVRLKRNHIMNTPPGFEAAYSILKMFISDKLKKRMKVHNQNFESLYRDIPKSILPFEYGGEDGSLQDLIDYWKEKVESYREWFLAQAHQRSDESKRPGKPKSSSEMFGIEGSFRKLEVD